MQERSSAWLAGAFPPLSVLAARVTGRVYFLSHPVATDPLGKFAYAANRGSQGISAYTIDSATGVLSAVAGSPFGTAAAPASVVVDPTGRFLYVANASNNLLSYTINQATGALSALGSSPFVGPTALVSVDPMGKLALSVDGVGSMVVFTIDAATGVLTFTHGPLFVGPGPSSIAVDPSGRFLYVTTTGTSRIPAGVVAFAIVNLTGSPPFFPVAGSPFAAGSVPCSVAVEPSGRFVYVANCDPSASTGTVTVLSINQPGPV